jgi:hypothetical protein
VTSSAERLGGGIGPAGVAAHAGAAVVLAGHEHAARGRADGGAGVEVGEAQALRGHAVEVGRGDDLLAVAAEIAVAEVIGHDPDEVGLRSEGRRRKRCMVRQG